MGSLAAEVGSVVWVSSRTAECRERFRKLMSDDARVQMANQKRQRFAEEQQERKRRKEEKREDKARKKKREEEEEETSRKRTCQSSGSSDAVVLGHGSKRKMEDDLGDDQMQMETEEIPEVEVQRWMNVMLVEEEQIELKDCESTFVQKRELDPEKVKEARLEEVQFMQKKRLWEVVPWPKDGFPVSLRWVDVVKGDGSTRSRLGCQRFQRFGSAPGRLLRSYTTIGSCKGSIEYGSHESTLESALQGGRLHRVTTRSRGRAWSVWQAQLLVVWIPQGGIGVGRLLC